MFFSDIHIHLLYGADDGAKNREEMFAMADKAYSDGTRLICATPHCCPTDFGDNRKSVETAFSELEQYCAEKYPDLRLFLGNELFCDSESSVWLKNGFCKTMNGNRYVLTEFPFGESEAMICKTVQNLLNSGYVPIIAHAERYPKLSIARIRELRQNGVLIQINARESFRGSDFFEKHRLKRILSGKLADIVSSDAHDLNGRPPCLSKFYKLVSRKYGVEYAESIFRTNGERILTEEN